MSRAGKYYRDLTLRGHSYEISAEILKVLPPATEAYRYEIADAVFNYFSLFGKYVAEEINAKDTQGTKAACMDEGELDGMEP